jgi:hypothetical protein
MLPNFIVIGATRCGTTSLHHYLGQHPEIYICPLNEPNFFVFDGEVPLFDDPYLRHLRATGAQWVRDPHAYEELFAGVRGEKAVGEVSPLYMQAPCASRLIRRTLPEVRLIAVLRHPVDRAYAQFMGRRREGLERRTSFEAIIREEQRKHEDPVIKGARYLAPSRYHQCLQPYYDCFPRERIHVGIFDDFGCNPTEFLRDIFRFLGVDPSFTTDTTTRHNPTGVIRNPVLRWIWTRSLRLRIALRPYLPGFIRHAAFPIFASNLVRPPLDPGLRAEFTELFREDIGRLQNLIGHDLRYWLR